MSGHRSVIGFINRYVDLAGRNCCSGKSWAALDRSLERHACEVPPATRDPDSTEPAESPQPAVSEPAEPDERPEPAVTLVADDVRA